MRRIWLILATLTVLVTMVASPAFPFLKIVPPSIPKAHAATRSVTLVGYAAAGWNMANPGPPITVTQGDTVTATLSSGDGSTHSFVVDVDKDMPFFSSTGCPPPPDTDKCSPTFSSTIYPIAYQFTVDFPPGTYSYYCSFHPTTMVGNFIVQPPPGPDFRVSSNPSSITILQGSKANSTITVTSLNNFAGPVTLSSSPSSPPGLMTSSFSRNPVTVPAGGTANSNFTISVPASTSPGSYSLTVTGSNSTTSRTTSVSVTVTAPASPDFTIISSPSSLNIPQGSSGTTTITLTSLNGFSGTVSLIASLSSNGPQVTFSPASVAVPSGGSISSTLSVSAASSGAYSTAVSQGSYTVTVTGTSGSLVHSTTLALTVGSSSGVGALPSAAIIGGAIAAAIAVVAGTVYVLRRRPKTNM